MEEGHTFEILSKVSKNLRTIPSGLQLRYLYKKFIIDQYKEEYISSQLLSLNCIVGCSMTEPQIFNSFLESDRCTDMDDVAVEAVVPSDYWFKSKLTRCLLATVVHWSNKEIAAECSTLPPGVTQVQQH
jgi:hypothetical protein